MNLRKLLSCMILGAIILSSGCIDALFSSPAKHETLVIALDVEPTSLVCWDFISVPGNERPVTQQLYGYLGMCAPGENVYTISGLAEDWSANADQTEWTFTLREGLTFHDGSPITAEDVEYSLRAAFCYGYAKYQIMEHAYDPAFGKFFNFTYSAPSSLTFTISSTTRLPDPMFEWDFCGIWNLYTVVPKDCFETVEKQDAFQKAAANLAGPYKLATENDSIPGESITLTRFDDWYGWGQTFTGSNGLVYAFPEANEAFKFIKYVYISDTDSKLIHLLSTDIDIVNFGNYPPSRRTADDLILNPDFKVYDLQTTGGAILQANIQGDWPSFYGGPGNFPVSETWFRQALSHAINRTSVVETVYNGFGGVRDGIYSETILEMFPNLLTDEYYDFGFNNEKAEQILDAAGYSPLAFPLEPDNRFGYGTYANETTVNGENQTIGRHFILMTPEDEMTIKRAINVQSQLHQIGIYVDLEIPPWDERTRRRECTPGIFYNATGLQPDPNYHGCDWDLQLVGYGNFYDTPNQLIPYFAFALWYSPNWGWGSHGWFNETYEIAWVKMHGGRPGYWWWNLIGTGVMDPPQGMPIEGYTTPDWINEDSQYMEGCSIAGKILSHELPVIPLTWYHDVYAYNSKIKNLIIGRNDFLHLAYTYWE